MTRFYMNVGLEPSASIPTPTLTPEQRKQRVMGWLASAIRVSVDEQMSSTERTLVIAADDYWPFLRARIEKLAAILEQDAIAVVIDGKGELLGPRATQWGAFKPSEFIYPEGAYEPASQLATA